MTQSREPKAELSKGCLAADKSKTVQRRRRKVRASELNIYLLTKTDRLPKRKIWETE
ncbi:MAG: hypothetical protein Fur002_08620 [Anaerolineales bacterium]